MRLPKLPERAPVKITINVSPALQQALSAYAEFYRAVYGEAEPVTELIPAMLQSFIDGDRDFLRRQREAV